MSTKHEQILEYIESLTVGARISVRGIAREMQVSEGTAYRAIKDAEVHGFVSAMDRVGTVRIERKEPREIESLTYAEVVSIVEGTVLGGHAGLQKTLHKFVIGAMRQENIARYLDPGSLMLVGNRENVQKLSLDSGAAVLITGGFDASEEVRKLANSRELPIISCSYDTFTTAAMINRAIYDRLIKKDILFVGDVAQTESLAMLPREATVRDYFHAVETTGHARLPVVDSSGRLVGVVTARDVADCPAEDSVELHMSRSPVTVTPQTTVASAAHRMVWEGIEMLPVIHNRKLVGILTRQDVIKSLQVMNRQPQIGETLEDMAVRGFVTEETDSGGIRVVGRVTPQLTSGLGTLSSGMLTTLMEHAARECLRRRRNVDMAVENMSIYFLKPVSIEANLHITASVLDFGRRFAKVEVDVESAEEHSARALITTQLMER